MEYNENTEETNEMENEEQEESGIKQWLQDNLRIIISVLIVVVIAAGIYSYSNRTIAPQTAEKISQEEDLFGSIAGDENVSKEEKADDKTTKQAETEKNTAKKEQNQASSISTSQETEKSFVETAVRGDGTTKLARRALANYLEKNPDASLTAEHKIYIEDYMRKNVSPKGKVSIGQSVEFSKDLIQQAISSSKNLNQKQLNNLHQYAVRVPSLS
ncbi:MAG TPA: hypothetical protein P5262_03780 [Candidatus Moranbacteria bacterium]|nr:hypothetical protein [Candidatus Moranbacteria bacterium]